MIFAGIKVASRSWYGFSDGQVCYEDGAGCSSSVSARGWWADGFRGQLLFYDVNDLARVASGEWESWQPQPYASLDLDQWLFAKTPANEFRELGGATFDRERGILYLSEPRADGDKPVIHVWRLRG